MSDQERWFDVDRWDTRPPAAVDDPCGSDPWQALGHGDLATGTCPGVSLDDEPAPPPGLARTRITVLGDGTSSSEQSFYQPFGDQDRSLPAGTSRLPSLADRTPLWAVMGRQVICVRPELSTESLISMLATLDLRSVPVVGDDGRPVGVVSRSDLRRHRRAGDDGEPALRVAGPYGGHGEYLGPGFHTDVESERVADVMMCLTFSLPETATLSRAAAIMAYEGVHRIPVVGSDGKVVGLISSLDVVRWLANHDGYVVPGGG